MLPSELVTSHPAWIPPPAVHGPDPFPLRFPHVRSSNTSLWDALHDMDDINNRALQERILPLCREMEAAYHYEAGEKRAHGMPVALVRKFGETSIRLLRRVWDMHLAYTTTPHVPGVEPGYGGDLGPGFFDSSFNIAIRDVVLKRLHYTDDIMAAQAQDAGELYFTDVLSQHLNDCHERALEERRVLAALYEEVGRRLPNQLTQKKFAALGETPLLVWRRCDDTVFDFHHIHREVVDECQLIWTRENQKFVLRNIVARAVDPELGWESSRQEGSMDSVLSAICDDILETRRLFYGVELDPYNN
ncbi:hypothetical protein B0J13DRAFT_662994 [Dactylonectria estremocensis]|uniref:Uncharacterized protein n=1 Tax=Dactylonectria estremocensis TaxID=1079267 RepID=A0A9P9JAL9_9HYPO|nr:hypothetical protein B0J13DRAFT_662994 [Dactylonectria estremocensis]